MEDHKSYDVKPPVLIFDFCDKARRKTVIVQQAIVAVDRPMREVVPRTLDIHNPVDVPFADLTNSDLQCFHEQSPRPFCARKEASTACSVAWPPVPRSLRPDRGASSGCAIPAFPRSPIDTGPLHRRRESAVGQANTRTTRRVLARPRGVLQQEYLRSCGR